MISFVAYYVELSEHTMDNIHQNTKTITVTEPFRFIQTMFNSATHFHSGCRCIILSDQDTVFPFDADIDIIRFDLDSKQPMLSRSQAWLSYLEQANSHVVFLDSDILINASLAPVFENAFDVALTYRDETKWPINAGINFVHGEHLAQGQTFYQAWLDLYKTQHSQASIWGGDQDVLREMLKEVDYSRTDAFIHEQDAFKIYLLPCSSYNYSSIDEQMADHYPDKKVLHFKGRRKSAMLPYWERYLEVGS